MIVSHEHRFIFLKTFKTAGTSIELGLARYCGPGDVITPVDEEPLRRALGVAGPQNEAVPFSRYRSREVARVVRDRRRVRFVGHTSARSARRWLGPRVWDSYFKFAVERNPWDKAISWYFWVNRENASRPSLSEWLGSNRLYAPGFDVYTIDGRVSVDRILRFESLGDELAQVAATLGLPHPVDLPSAKSEYRADRRHYREVLTPADRDRIADAYAREIALMGFEY